MLCISWQVLIKKSLYLQFRNSLGAMRNIYKRLLTMYYMMPSKVYRVYHGVSLRRSASKLAAHADFEVKLGVVSIRFDSLEFRPKNPINKPRHTGI